MTPTPMDRFAAKWNAHNLAIGNPVKLARAAVLRSESEPGEAHVAIVFSAAAVDAFLVDVVHLADCINDASTSPTIEIQALAEARGALRSGGIGAHLQLVRSLTSRTVFDVSTVRWESVRMLTRLRNELVHLKAHKYRRQGEETDEFGAPIRHLRKIGVLPLPTEIQASVHYAPTAVVSGPTVARWAFGTASAVVAELVEALPRDTTPLWQLIYLYSGWAREPIEERS